MKKFMLALTVLAVIGFTSCSSDDDGGGGTSCTDAIQAAADAGELYGEDPDANCTAYRSALEDLIDACGDTDGATQTLIDALTCE